MRFCHTDRKMRESEIGKLCNLLFGSGKKRNAVSAVYFFDQCFDAFFDRAFKAICVSKVRFFFLAKTNDLLGKINSALAALCPDLREDRVDRKSFALFHYEGKLLFGIGREAVDRNNAGKTEYLADIFHVAQKIRNAALERAEILGGKLGLFPSAVHL